MTNSMRFGGYVLLWAVAVMFAIASLSCDHSRSNERSVNVWIEDEAHVYTTTAKNIGVGTKSPSAPFSVFRNGSNMSGTGFAVAAFDPKDPDKGIWLGYDADGVTGIIGADSDGNTASHLAFWTHDGAAHGERARLASNGNFGFGTPVPQERVHIKGNLRVQGVADCVIGKSAGGVSCSSDERLKEHIRPIDDPLQKILALRGVEFQWNKDSRSPGRQGMGLIAQDVAEVFPLAVADGDDGYKMLDHAVLVAPLIEAVREIKERNEELSRELEAVKKWACIKEPSAVWCDGRER